MAGVTFRVERQHVANPHFYAVYRPDAPADWLDQLADVYVALRATPRTPLPASVLDGIDVVQRGAVERLLATATVPRLTTGGWSDIIRADLGEVLAYELLEQVFGMRIAYKLVRDRELVRFAGRGIDAIGAEPFAAGGEPMSDARVQQPATATEPIEGSSARVDQETPTRATEAAPSIPMLILAEVKVSEDAASPPQVVDGSSNTSMRNQHLGHIREWQQTTEKVWLAVRNATDAETQRLLTQIALRLERDKDSVSIVACCILIRPVPHVADTDCGTFRTTPTDYAPTRIRFLTVALPGDLATTLTNWDAAIRRAIERRGTTGEAAAA